MAGSAARTRLIDLTRLTSRLGIGALTGIDRVELAWACHLLSVQDPLFGLVRMKLGYALLDRAGVQGLVARVTGQVPLGPGDRTGRILWRRNPQRARAEADLRRIAVARALPWGLARLLRPLGGLDYLNLGHANLTAPGLRTIRRFGSVSVLLHDTIPLDYPQFTRAGIPPVFARKLAAVSAHADRVIHTTKDARAKSEAHLAAAGRVPPGIVAPLGVGRAQAGDLPPGLGADPFVLALGTIEPRKNLDLLAKVWAATPGLPRLLVVGNRGWAAPDLFTILETTPGITLLGPLPDATVAALMDRALALIFPSFAEGYGLPPLEAVARGLPVLCSDLPVLREVLRDLPVYLDPTDVYAWTKAIQSLGQTGAEQTDRKAAAAGSGFDLPTWEAHFNLILTTPTQDPLTGR